MKAFEDKAKQGDEAKPKLNQEQQITNQDIFVSIQEHELEEKDTRNGDRYVEIMCTLPHSCSLFSMFLMLNNKLFSSLFSFVAL